jgi:hypothetical protein
MHKIPATASPSKNKAGKQAKDAQTADIQPEQGNVLGTYTSPRKSAALQLGLRTTTPIYNGEGDTLIKPPSIERYDMAANNAGQSIMPTQSQYVLAGACKLQ